MSLHEWVGAAARLLASDVHVEADTPPVMRVRGELATAGAPVPAEHVEQVGRELLGERRWDDFLARGSADLSVDIASVRCRVNVFRTVRGVGYVISDEEGA